MRYLFIIIICTFFSCQSGRETKVEEAVSFEVFDRAFPKEETFKLDTNQLFNFYDIKIFPLLQDGYYKYFNDDSISVLSSKIQDSLFYINVSVFAKTEVKPSLTNYVIGINKWTREYRQKIIRGNLFQDSTHIASFNLGLLALSVHPEKNDSYAVFFSTHDSLVYQQKVALSSVENEDREGPDYFYTLLDTLETSQLIIQPNGSLSGKNLVVIHD